MLIALPFAPQVLFINGVIRERKTRKRKRKREREREKQREREGGREGGLLL